MSVPLQLHDPVRPVWLWWLLGLTGAAGLGVAVAFTPVVGLLLCALAVVVVAVRWVELLSVAMFLTLPYMVANLPTGAFTLKLCDAVAYLFAGAWAARALLRRDRVFWPPATGAVLVYLAVLAVSTAFSPPVPRPYLGDVDLNSRNAPDFRSISLIVWLGLSWLVVVALYNVVGSRPDLYRRCVCTHILGSGIACVIGLVMYGLALFFGFQFHESSMGRSLIFLNGDYLRLAGVAYEPLFMGFYLTTVIPVTVVVRQLRPGWIPRRLVTLVLALQCLALLLTFSAGGWAAMVISMLILAPLLLRHMTAQERKRLGVSLAALAVLVGVGCVVVPKVRSTISSPLSKIAGGGDPVRKNEWAVGYAVISDHPFLGIGPGLARFYFGRYDFQRSTPLFFDQEINSVYINVVAESGVVGGLAFVWCAFSGIRALLTVVWRRGVSNVPILTALVASLFGVAAQYTSLNSLFLVYFPALIGITVAGMRLSAGEGAVEAPGGARETALVGGV